MTIRVMVIDDQAMIRGALAGLLDLETDIEVVAQAANGVEALDELARLSVEETTPRTRPPVDVAIIDVEMPRMDGITATEAIRTRFPSVRVLVVTTFGRPGYLQRALAAGASGFMVKDAPVEDLVDGVRTVAAGGRTIDQSLAIDALSAGASPLTARETDVLREVESELLILEIPRANDKSELAAEQMFASLHGILRDARELKINDGYQEHLSFEIASVGGQIQFYVACTTQLR